MWDRVPVDRGEPYFGAYWRARSAERSVSRDASFSRSLRNTNERIDPDGLHAGSKSIRKLGCSSKIWLQIPGSVPSGSCESTTASAWSSSTCIRRPTGSSATPTISSSLSESATSMRVRLHSGLICPSTIRTLGMISLHGRHYGALMVFVLLLRCDSRKNPGYLKVGPRIRQCGLTPLPDAIFHKFIGDVLIGLKET